MRDLLYYMTRRLLYSPDGDGGGKAVDPPVEDEDEEDEEDETVEDEEAQDEEDEDEEDEAPPATKKGAATSRQIRKVIPGASADQILRYTEAGLTVKQAKAMYKGEPKAGKRKSTKRPGGPGVQSGATEPGQARSRQAVHPFEKEAKRRVKETGCSERDAQGAIAYEQPNLYQSYRDSFKDNERFGGATQIRRRV